jgi:uncharacterized protein YpmS
MARVFEKKKSFGMVKLFFFIIVVIALLISIWWVSGSLSASQNEEQLKIAEDAVRRATVQCYSLEGRYPPGLDYLVENYGLTLNKDKYIYHYSSVGTNMMPTIRVFTVSGTQGA